ncbi:MAG: hypothetical protein K8J09_07975, partial [Planctomycetes bacterium]|nr:hypothetical protein [Planctomycetota bacterium]
MTLPPAPRPPFVPALLRSGAVAYVLAGLWLMVAAAPRVPYADPWRFLVGFLDTPFPASAFAADNGHREVLPNLVRIAELHWFDYDQTLQIGLAVLLALLALGLAVRR